MRRATLAAIALCLVAVACDFREPHILLTIEDPEQLACDAQVLVVGRDLANGTRLELEPRDRSIGAACADEFPRTATLVNEHPESNVDIWIEARTSTDRALARGHVRVDFEEGRTGTATVGLAGPCDLDAECPASSSCRGPSRCVDRVCRRGIPTHGELGCLRADTSTAITVCLDGRCERSRCGDAFVDVRSGEACDLGADNSDTAPDGCRTTCHWGVCGDGVVDAGEICDDGNATSGDGCAADCKKIEFCGDGVVDVGEECDDVNANPNDACDLCRDVVWTATVAIGLGPSGGDPHATDLSSPRAIAVDPAGNIFVAVASQNRVFRIDGVSNHVTVFAGRGTPAFSGDGGYATEAELNLPNGVAVEARGACVIADSLNERLRVVNADGTISTLATNLGFPIGLVLDADGSVYFADPFAHIVVRVDATTGAPTTIAGTTNVPGSSGDGASATSAPLSNPHSVALDRGGNVYIADSGNHRVRRVGADGNIETIAGNGTPASSGDGEHAKNASLFFPSGLAVDRDGNLYIAERDGHRVRRVLAANGIIGADAIIETVAGTGVADDGKLAPGEAATATTVALFAPTALAVAEDRRDLVVADAHRVYRLRFDAIVPRIERVAGIDPNAMTRSFRANDTPLHHPLALAIHPSSGALYIADDLTGRLYAWQPDAPNVEVVAGIGVEAAWRDGQPATISPVPDPAGIAFDPQGRVLVSSAMYGTIARIDRDADTIGTFASGSAEIEGRVLSRPYGMARDREGRLIVADMGNHRLVAFDEDGVGTVVAGTGQPGCSLGGGFARAAELNRPRAVAIDHAGNIVLADWANHRILRIGRSEPRTIALVYGSSACQPSAAGLAGPHGVAVGPDDSIYVADHGHHRIVRIDPRGAATVVAGVGRRGFSGEHGPANEAMLDAPFAVTTASDGTIFIADSGNARVRRVDTSGIIETVVGQVTAPDMGAFARAKFQTAAAMVWIDAMSSFLVAGGTSGRVFRADMDTRTVSVVAGEPGGFDDGADPNGTLGADRALFSRLIENAAGIAFDPRNNVVYVSERGGNAIRRLAIAGDPSTWTIATWATSIDGLAFDAPAGLAFDPLNGILYVADSGNHLVRAIDVDDEVEVFRLGRAGEPGIFGGDGRADDLWLEGPEALVLAPREGGALYIADTGNHRVLRVASLDGEAVVSTVIGDGSAASGGDGLPASVFPVHAPRGLALDGYGNLFLTSTNTVRVVSAGDDGIADGTDATYTIYGRPPRVDFPMSVTKCLTGLHVDEASTVRVLDACQGFMLELAHRR